ncbi:hypothetical protein I4U23_011821 [Adineta vaga]|nr:hypothetical protein I4U23_011821 [Adineta vaga]
MKYEKETEEVLITDIAPIPLTEDREVQRTRKILLVIFSVFLALHVFSMITFIFHKVSSSSTSTIYAATKSSNRQLLQTILGLFFYSFAYYVTHKYHSIGLRVVAWLVIISAVLFCIIIGIIAFMFIIMMTGVQLPEYLKYYYAFGGILITFIVVVSNIVLIIHVIIVKLSFNLARLIDAKKNLPI